MNFDRYCCGADQAKAEIGKIPTAGRVLIMKEYTISMHIVLLGVFACISCGCSSSPVEPPLSSNILMNESFETDHAPLLEGWRFGNPQLAQLVEEAPPDGGNWSLELTSDWAPTTGYVYRPVKNVKSGDIVRLTAFVRGSGRFGGRGIIELTIDPNRYNSNSKSASSADTVWNQISVSDTLKLQTGDTLWVVLSSPVTEIVPYQQEFDLIRLEKITN